MRTPEGGLTEGAPATGDGEAIPPPRPFFPVIPQSPRSLPSAKDRLPRPPAISSNQPTERPGELENTLPFTPIEQVAV